LRSKDLLQVYDSPKSGINPSILVGQNKRS